MLISIRISSNSLCKTHLNLKVGKEEKSPFHHHDLGILIIEAKKTNQKKGPEQGIESKISRSIEALVKVKNKAAKSFQKVEEASRKTKNHGKIQKSKSIDFLSSTSKSKLLFQKEIGQMMI